MSITTLRHVKPGDLIESEFMNSLLDALQSLDVRLTSLEVGETGNRPPVLLERSPSGNVEVNSRLTLIGRNFLRPSEQNTVTLGGVPINQFDGDSDETNLIFTVPNVFSGLPRSVPVTVKNRFGESVALQVGLLPHVETQGGQVVIFDQTPTLGQIVIGNTYDLGWLVDSQTVLPVTYNFSLVFSDVVGASVAAWRAESPVTPSGPRQIARGAPLLVTAKVKVPTGAISAQIALKTESQDHAFLRTSPSLDFTVGETPAVSDSRALLTLVAEIPPFDSTGAPNSVRNAIINGANGVEVRFGSTGKIPINIHVGSDQSAAGTYRFSATVEDSAGLWTGGPVAPPESGRAAPSDRRIEATIQNSDTGNSTTVKFMVVSAIHRTQAGAEDFTSFVRFPIRGFAA